MNPIPEKLFVSDHAVQRCLQRVKDYTNREFAKNRLLRMVRNGKEVQLKPKYRVNALLNHNYQESRYFKHGGHIVVLSHDIIVTVHSGEYRRYEPIG